MLATFADSLAPTAAMLAHALRSYTETPASFRALQDAIRNTPYEHIQEALKSRDEKNKGGMNQNLESIYTI
jgi:hypothetical protein